MESEWKLFAVLKALASSSKKALTTKTLMQKSSYKNHKQLNRDLKKLRELGLIEFQHSGFPSDSKSHHRIVVLKAEPILVHSEVEAESQAELSEDDKIAIRLTNPRREFFLVAIRTPFGHLSYQTLDDFLKLPIDERKNIYLKYVEDLTDGTTLKLDLEQLKHLEENQNASMSKQTEEI